ncbi:MAG: TetR/AcrR family transcriptional regulator [Actinomycetota bacterium]
MTDGTAEALIDAAESRFAAEGFERASLRAVMRDAGTDPGAVHYHFGGREALAEAVLDRVLVPLNDRRLALLAQLEAADRPIGVAALVEVLIRPDLEAAVALAGRGAGRARLLGAIYLHPAAFVTSRVEQRFAPVAARFQPHLVAALPGVPSELIGWRIRWLVFGSLGALLADPVEPFAAPIDVVVARLVSAASAAVAAPDPAPEFEPRRTP